ncbi:MAG: hypothetical protein AAF411_21700, partial [Myxococcota bacterium]
RRQALHHDAERAATLDAIWFSDKAKELYGYPNFICDSSGSLCEIVDATDPNDTVLSELSKSMLPIWIKGSEAHTAALIERFDRDPKPMCYQPEFLSQAWATYRSETGESETQVDPDAFVRWTYARALAHRQPRYAAMAEWGITIPGELFETIASELVEFAYEGFETGRVYSVTAVINDPDQEPHLTLNECRPDNNTIEAIDAACSVPL